MGREVIGAGVIEVTGQSHVSMAEEDHVRCGTGDQKVRAHVKLFPLQEQRTLDVTEGGKSVYNQLRPHSLSHMRYVILLS